MNRVETPIKQEANVDVIEGKKEDSQDTNFGLIDIQIKSDDNLRQKEDVDDQDCVQTPRPFNESETALAITEERNKKNSSKTEEEYLKLKALVTIPYLPPLEPSISLKPVYTLVLDLDETLIHLECDEEGDPLNPDDEGIYYLIRPGTIRFLNELAKYFELVIFTAAMPDVPLISITYIQYADWILDNIDRKQIVSHRLYRQHTTPHEDYAM